MISTFTAALGIDTPAPAAHGATVASRVRMGAVAAAAAAAVANAWLMAVFYDQHWYAVDEGIYAHIAERLLGGEVLNRDIQALHPGYINFVNAGAFALFGIDLVSLRYPLVLVTLSQAALVWLLFARRDLVVAILASVAVTALGILQFLNPTAHWYCLFLTVALACWLQWVPRQHRARIVGAGILLGTITLFRHLTGIWVAMGLLIVLMHEESGNARGWSVALGRAVALLLLAVLLAYVALTGDTEPSGVLLIAVWPAAILALVASRLATPNRAVVRVLGALLLGATLAALPLLGYHVFHGSLEGWIRDTVFTSVGAAGRPLYQGAWFGVLPIAGLIQLLSRDPVAMVNGLYWIVVALAPAINGVLAIRALRQDSRDVALPVIAAFYGVVTLHLAGPVYLSFSAGLTAAGVLWFVSDRACRRTLRVAASALTAAVVVVAIWFQAAQSSQRSIDELTRGTRSVTVSPPRCAPMTRSNLRVERAECEPYERLVAAIEQETPAGEAIFAVPSDSELYFLTARPNPFPFYNTAFGVRSDADLAAVLDVLRQRPPRVVAFRPADKYNTEASHAIMRQVRSTYVRVATIDGVELYRPAAAAR